MAGVDLLFRAPRPAPAAHTDLTFGADAPASSEAALTVAAMLAAPEASLTARAFTLHGATLVATLAPPVFSGSARYSDFVPRGPGAQIDTSWQPAAPLADLEPVRRALERAARLPAVLEPAWQGALPLDVVLPRFALRATMARLRLVGRVRFAGALARPGVPAHLSYDEATRTRAAWTASAARAQPVHRGALAAWQASDHGARRSIEQAAARALGVHLARRARYQDAARARLERRARHQDAMRAPPGVSPALHYVAPRPPPCYLPPPGAEVDLLFALPAAAADTALVFSCPQPDTGGPTGPAATIVVPVRRVYLVTNLATLHRVDTGEEVPAVSLSLSIDADSWTWGFSAQLPGAALAMLEPEAAAAGEPVELEASINGQRFRVLAEQVARERTFGQDALRVQGRGLAALLDAPYAAIRAHGGAAARTAQQLALEALAINGVSSGWSIDWRIPDWLVPGGAWSMQATPVAAVAAIAQAAGAYVQPHGTERVLRVLPRYPAAPWAWSGVAPDVELPADVTVREAIEWVRRAEFNRVFVSGAGPGGVLAQVTRAGTAGDVLAPTVVDALVTDAIAASGRGLAVLGNTGAQANVALRVPVLPEAGVILPGAFVRYVAGGASRVGLVRSTHVEAGLPQVFQTIGVETHV